MYTVTMKIINENDRYIMADARGTNFSGPYQLLEKSTCFPVMTIGIYKSKKDLKEAFVKITKDDKGDCFDRL